MKNGIKKRILSLVLCISMILPMIAQPLPVYSVAETLKEPADLEANIGKQAVFDWWTEFFFVDDPTRSDIDDIYDTAPETPYTDKANYWYYYSQSDTYPDSPYINAWEALLKIDDYYYDSENGYHWYQVSCDNPSDELAEVLQEKSWILYTSDSDIASACDPYLVIYEEDEAVRFVTSATLEDITDESGDVIRTTTSYNYYVVAGPASIQDVTIDITRIYSDYPVSSLAYTELTYLTTFSKGYSISLYTEDEDKNKTPWVADGTLSVRYEATQFGGASYTEDVLYGAAYMYVDNTMVSADLNDLYNWDSVVASEVLYTSGASSTLVFEHLCPNSDSLGYTGFFTEDTVKLYDNTLENYKEVADSDYADGIHVECVVYQRVLNTDDPENPVITEEIPWYWISSGDGSYFLVQPEYVEFAIVEEIFWDLMETVSKEDYEDIEDAYADVLAVLSFTDEQQTMLEEHYSQIPYMADIVYTTWSGRVGPLMPPITLVSPYARLARSSVSFLAGDTESEAVDNSALKTSKIVKDNGDGTFTITIEAYAEGQVTVTTTKTAVDVVLVLDMSSSMKNNKFGSLTREQAVEDATQAFVAAVIRDGTDNNIDHRISVITYNSSASIKCGLKNVLTNASTITNAVSDTSLTTATGTRSDLGLEAAESVFDGTATATNDAYTSSSRQRVVVFFTDGYPSTSGSTNFDGTYAKNAINSAYGLKNTYGATVYSVAVLDKADPDGDLAWSGRTGTNTAIGVVNGYLHAISSNYKNANANFSSNKISIYDYGTESSQTQNGFANNDYYLTAKDPDDLNNIFNTVSNTVISGSTSVELGTETKVTDIVTPYFTVPENNSDVTVKVVDCTGYTNSAYTWATTGTTLSGGVSISGNTLDISGFDFTANYVASTARPETEGAEANFYGRKVVIEFSVTIDPLFLGGSGVPTNGSSSGVYDKDGVLYENLIAVPGAFDFALKNIDTVAQDRYIYLGNTVDLTDILNLHVVDTSNQMLLQDIANGINNAYVDLKYTVTINGSDVVYYTIPAGYPWNEGTWTNADGVSIDMSKVQVTGDTPYAITCVMSDKNGKLKSTTANGSAMIYVYKPTFTFKDSVQEYNKALNLGTDIDSFLAAHYVGVTWTHSSVGGSPEGNEPEIVFGYSYADGAFDGFVMKSTTDVPVSVSVTIKGYQNGESTQLGESLWLKNLTHEDVDKIVFAHLTCSLSDCGFNPKTEEFIVHVIKALTSLTIKKSGYSSYATVDPNQTFLFRVEGEGVDLIVTVHGNGSTKINGLKVGSEYTVTELTDWSWRYEFSSWDVSGDITTSNNKQENGATITLGATGNTITFTNTREESKWLDGDTYEDNHFNQK